MSTTPLSAIDTRLKALEMQLAAQSRRISHLEREVHTLRYWEPLQAFPLFPKLPKELRHIIWSFSVREPRLMELEIRPGDKECETQIGYHDGESKIRFDVFIGQVRDKDAMTRYPPLPHTCRESRAIALLGYDRCFAVSTIVLIDEHYDAEEEKASVEQKMRDSSWMTTTPTAHILSVDELDNFSRWRAS